MSYGTFADGQICAQTYVTLLPCAFLHTWTVRTHQQALLRIVLGTALSRSIHTEELIGLLHCMANNRHTQPPSALLPQPAI